MPIVGLNRCLPILHMSTILVHCYTTCKIINQFPIGYMINPSLKFNNAFRTQHEKFLVVSFSIRKMKAVNNCLMKKSACVMAIIVIYENKGGNTRRIIYSVNLYCLYSHRPLCLY